MATAKNRTPTTMGAFESPPRGKMVAQNPKTVTFSTNPEAKDQETIEIRSRPPHHPFSSQRQQHVPRSLRKPYVKRAKPQLNNTGKKSTDHDNDPLTRDECVLLFTTLTAPIVEAMKLRTKEVLAFKQMMLAEQQAQLQKQRDQLQKERDFDQSFEQMLQSFLTQNKPDDSTEISNSQSSRQSQRSDTSEKIPTFEIATPEKIPTFDFDFDHQEKQTRNSQSSSESRRSDTSEKIPTFEIATPEKIPTFDFDFDHQEKQTRNSQSSSESRRSDTSEKIPTFEISAAPEQIRNHPATIHPTPTDRTTNPASTCTTHPTLLPTINPTTYTTHPAIHPTTGPTTNPTTDPTSADPSSRPLFRALNGFLSFPTPPDRPSSNHWLPYSTPNTTPVPSPPMPMPRAHLKPLFRALTGLLSFPTPPPDCPRSIHCIHHWLTLII
jgi:hypothetical protein